MRVSAKTLLVPVLAGAAILGSYLAGQYVGAHDTRKVYEKALTKIAADASAEKLWFASEAMRLITDANADGAHQMLAQYANLQVGQVSACLGDVSCASTLGGEDKVKQLRALVVTHSKSGG